MTKTVRLELEASKLREKMPPKILADFLWHMFKFSVVDMPQYHGRVFYRDDLTCAFYVPETVANNEAYERTLLDCCDQLAVVYGTTPLGIAAAMLSDEWLADFVSGYELMLRMQDDPRGRRKGYPEKPTGSTCKSRLESLAEVCAQANSAA